MNTRTLTQILTLTLLIEFLKPDPKPRNRGTQPGQCDPIAGHIGTWAIPPDGYNPDGTRTAICINCHETETFQRGQLLTHLELTDNYPYNSMTKS